MPLVGDAEYPQTRPEAALAVIRRLAAQFQGQSFDAEACAAALGYRSARNGAFRQILADLRKYGLVSGRGNGIQATELLRRLVVPLEDEDRVAARLEMMNCVPLFRELYARFEGRVPSEESLTSALIQITRADRLRIQSCAPRVRTLLVEGWGSAPFPVRKKPMGDPANPSPPEERTDPAPLSPRSVRFDAGGVRLEFPFTPDGLFLLRSNLGNPTLWSVVSRGFSESGKPADLPRKGTASVTSV